MGKNLALYNRHEMLVKEFQHRGYKHHTPLDFKFAEGCNSQTVFINSISEQKLILENKPCDCLLQIR